MIKSKVISLAMIGTIGIGSVVIARVNWNQEKALANSSKSVVNYVTQSKEAMVKSKSIIEQQNKEIEKLKQENSDLSSKVNTLNNQLNQENQMLGSLNKVIASLQGSQDYKHMTVAEKRKTLNNLLRDWGYGEMSIRIADKIFSWTDGWGLYQIDNNSTKNDSTLKNTQEKSSSNISVNAK